MRILIVLLALFASSAFADCTVTFTTVGAHEAGKQKLTSTNKWEGLETSDVAIIYAGGMKIVDVASKEQGKAKAGGNHSIDFTRQKACDGVTSAPESIRVEGLSWNGVSKVLREADKQHLALVKAGDDNVAKGRKTGWGK